MKYILLIVVFVPLSLLKAQIPTTTITGPQTFRSISAIDASGGPVGAVGIEDMITASIRRLYSFKYKVLPSGIDADMNTETIGSTLTNESAVDALPSYIKVKVFAYNASNPYGKGSMIFGMYSSESTAKNNYETFSWLIPSTKKTDGTSEDIKSTEIGYILKRNVTDYYFTDNPNCDAPTQASGWMTPTPLSKYSPDCFYKKGKYRIQPVIVEVTVKNASFRGMELPGIGIIKAEYFPIQNPAPLDVVEMKGSNYEINSFATTVHFGHQFDGAPKNGNRFEVSGIKTAFRGAKFTGIYGSTTTINNVDESYDTAYFKVNLKANQELLVALKSGQTLTASKLGSSGFTPSQVTTNAFTIADYKDNNETQFNIWRVSSSTSSRTLKFLANTSGPFIVATAFDVGFKQNTAMPADRRKIFNRADYLDEVLVCAHRGLWAKAGSHDYTDEMGVYHAPDYSGTAENTIPVYDEAINDPNIDWIEFDGRRTKDGVFVAWHDEQIFRMTNKYDDRECIPINVVNERNRAWVKTVDPDRTSWNKLVKNYDWSELKDLHLRDYMGCKVKHDGNYVNPLKMEDALQWLRDQADLGNHIMISMDFKDRDGIAYMHELFQMILERDLEDRVIFSLYARSYSVQDYQAEYGVTFLRQLPLKPTFYEPDDTGKQYGGDLPKRLKEYVNIRDKGHSIFGFSFNINNDQEQVLVDLLNQDPPAFSRDKMWQFTHYEESYMVSFFDNFEHTTPADCNLEEHMKTEKCVHLFWRAHFDWLMNNGVNAIFSDNPESLINYLIAKGLK
ncbi:MAG: glycerophosphodiester phosphodiesterase family protein [Bacteroidota bacterium]